MIKRTTIAFIHPCLSHLCTVHLFRTIPTAFVPNEDQGYVMGQLIMPDSASLNRTSRDIKPR